MILGILAMTAIPAWAMPQDDGPDLAEAYFQFVRARTLELNGQWEEALQAFDEALALDPTNSSIYSEIAFAYYARNDGGAAIDYAERAILMDPDNLDAHRLLSDVYTRLLARSDSGLSREMADMAIHEWEEVIRLDPTDRAVYLTLGRLYRVIGDSERAAAVYRDFLRVEPASEEGAVSLAELQIEAGNLEEAISILNAFIESQGDSDATLALLGDVYYRTGDFENASETLERAYERTPENAELLTMLADSLFLANRLEEAAVRYEAMLDQEPNDPVIRLRLGQIYRQRMEYDRARVNIEAANRLVPNTPEIRFEMALVDRDEGQFEDALDGFRGLLDDTERPFYTATERQQRQRLLTHIAIVQSLLSQFAEAVDTFGEVKALLRDVDDGTLDAYIVDTLRMADLPQEALDHVRTARQTFPENRALEIAEADLTAEIVDLPQGIALLRGMLSGAEKDQEVYATLVGVYERVQDYDSAQGVLDEMLAKLGDDQTAWFLQGALYERQENIDGAENAFRSALTFDAENPATLNYLGYMLADRNRDLDEALSMLKTAVASDPINGAYLDSLGWAYFRLDEWDLAERFLTRAVLFSDSDPTLHEHLGDLYRSTGRITLARESYLRSLERSEDDEERNRVQQKLDEL